jgi:DNA-binding transcriptional regulator GbsR (MarR family)
MYFDHAEANFKKQCKETYEKLKKLISSQDESQQMSEFFMAYEHIIEMENKIKEQEKIIKEYQNFFGTLKNFLPKSYSERDIIG